MSHSTNQCFRNLLTPDLWYSGGRSIHHQVASPSPANTTFNLELITTASTARSTQPSRSCSASTTNALQQQAIIEENRRGNRNVTRPEMATTTSTPGASTVNANSHMNLRTLYSKISSTSGGSGGRSGRSIARKQQTPFNGSTMTTDMVKGMLSSLRASSGRGVGVTHRQQRVAGLCVLSGDLLVASPHKTWTSDIEVERSGQRSVSLLRPQLLGNRKQQQQQQQQQQQHGASVNCSGVKTHRLTPTRTGEFVASVDPSTSLSFSPLTPPADAAVDYSASNGADNGNGNSIHLSPPIVGRQRWHSSADGFDNNVTESSTPFTGRIRYESMSGRQFQTITSRLQLATVRAPPEFSLLVRLAQ